MRDSHDKPRGQSTDPAAEAGSESAEEGEAAMGAAQDAVVDAGDDDS